MTIRQRAAVPKISDMVVSKDMYNGDKPHPSPNFSTQQDEELTWKSLVPAVAVSILVSIAAYYACGNTVEMMEDVLVATGKSAFVLFYDMNSSVQYKVSTTLLFYLTLVCLY